ncbi:hypothetical protein ABT095_03905 [Kitasatospora sp. NPDC002227]|uniref:hypothetical protein n=1 Tax=Kitasatospora sp. NPDC002227 TaxID=3154773 RepID=UPI0033247437
MSDEAEWAYAPVSTLEGLLQRGRGLGAIDAPGDPTAGRLVRECVSRDCRWDGVDERDLYLARLMRDLELSPEPVVARLQGDEYECERAAGLLVPLAKGGVAGAREALRAYVHDGEHWVDVLQSLAAGWPVEWWDDLAGVARRRLAADRVPLWRSEPWVRWQVPAPEPVLRARPPQPVVASGRLLALLADPAADRSAKVAALRALAARGPEPGLIPLVPLLRAEGPMPLLGRAVDSLGVLAVPAAREWVTAPDRWLSWTGATVLAAHGEPRDVPVLVGQLAAHWAARDWCGPGRLAAGLARFGPQAAEAVPLLRRFWLRTPHSYERPAYLKALAAIDPSGLPQAYTESLWDCESDARLLGIASAPDTPQVRRRLAELRDDPMEDSEIRAAAGGRHQSLSPGEIRTAVHP